MNGLLGPLNTLFGSSRIGLGCMALTGVYGKVDKTQAIATIHTALNIGISHFDTAELYGPYINEELLAEALGQTTNAVIVATKFGYSISDGQIVGRDSRPETIRKSAEGSLRRLKRDQIDLFYQHRADPNVPIEDVIGTLAELRFEGKIGAAGLSGVDPSAIESTSLAMPITAVQNEFSILSDAAHFDSPGIVFVAHSPLARGLLSFQKPEQVANQPGDFRHTSKHFQTLRDELVQRVESRLLELSVEHGVQPSVIALAAVLARSPRVAVIPGAKTPEQIMTCKQASELELDPEAIKTLWQPQESKLRYGLKP